MLIEVRFDAGRFHGTPWGRHVNEGVVEWPPSPWRVTRALLATGFAKLGWAEVPTVGRELVDALASTPPSYWLPPANGAHTRHYMPANEGKKVRSDRVLDAFAYVGRGANDVLVLDWPVALSEAATRLLDAMLDAMAYLGRAESWVTMRRIDTKPSGLTRCAPAQTAPEPGHERIPLLSPMPAPEYARWRAARIDAATRELLEAAASEAEAKGKKAKAKLSAKEQAKLDALYPATLTDALLAATADLRAQGWSQPPGSEWLSYYRREDALRAPTRPLSAPRAGAAPTTALLALASDTQNGERLPSFEDVIRRFERLHKALVKRSDLGDGRGPSPCFTGRSETDALLEGHRHAHLVPLCLDQSGRHSADGHDPRRIDHVLVHCPMGFDDRALAALRQVQRTWAKDLTLFVTLVGLGEAGDFVATTELVTASARWESSTPFVPPRYLKASGKNDLEGQVRAELESRGLPEPSAVEVMLSDGQFVAATGVPPVSPRYRHFRKERDDAARRPAQRAAYHLRVTFAAPVRGPLALGYAAHFGLGLFAPVTST